MELGLTHYESSDSDNDGALTTQPVTRKVQDELNSTVLAKDDTGNYQSRKRMRPLSSSPRKKMRSENSGTMPLPSSPFLQEPVINSPLFPNSLREIRSTSTLPPPPKFDDGTISNVPPSPPFLSGVELNDNSSQHHKDRKADRQSSTAEEQDREMARIYFLPPQLQLRRPNVSTEDLNSYGYVKARP